MDRGNSDSNIEDGEIVDSDDSSEMKKVKLLLQSQYIVYVALESLYYRPHLVHGYDCHWCWSVLSIILLNAVLLVLIIALASIDILSKTSKILPRPLQAVPIKLIISVSQCLLTVDSDPHCHDYVR